MKRRSLERVERRRNLVELNLVDDPKPRRAIARRGCAGLSASTLLALALLVYHLGLR